MSAELRGMRNDVRPMNYSRLVTALVILLCVQAGTVYAQQMSASLLNPDGAQVQILPVRGSIFMISGAGGNITVSAGRDGVLLVDAGLSQMSAEVLAAVRRIQDALRLRGDLANRPGTLGGAETESRMPWHPSVALTVEAPPKPIRYIINTHAHADHVGGNEALAAVGATFTSGNVAGAIADAAEGAAVMAHENALNQMQRAERSSGALPTLTYFDDQYKFRTHFNGEGIRLVHIAMAHTNGDTLVYFRSSDVIATGDIFSMTSFPVIDVDNGGHIDGIIDGLNYIIDLSIPEFRTEGGTMIVPGRGRLADSAEVTYYRDMLTIIRDRVQHMIGEGLSLGQVQAARPTFGYNGQWGSETGPWTTTMFVGAVYQNLMDNKKRGTN